MKSRRKLPAKYRAYMKAFMAEKRAKEKLAAQLAA